MSRRMFVIVAVFASCLTVQLIAEDAAANRRKDETLVKADKIFGQRYTAVTARTPRFYEQHTGTGPPDEVIYWHGSSYVVELMFASDGEIARLALRPEALLHSNSWGDVPDIVELSGAEMQWLVASADVLQPLGKEREVRKAPDGCFQSGPNLYCADEYELAFVSHYHLERVTENQVTEVVLRDIQIWYRQFVTGVVEDSRTEGSQRQIRIAGQWYHGEKPGIEIFENARVGSRVSLITYGCTANENGCIAVPEESKPTALNR